MYCSILIDSGQQERALEAYFLGLKNEINILLILGYRIRHRQRHECRRLLWRVYDRILMIIFNMGQVYQSKGKMHLTTFCLRECRVITELKNRALEKDAKDSLI